MSLWTPAEITTDLWLDASDGSTITVDTGVTEWRDKSGNSRHASQGTAANQPTVLANDQNGLPVINFDGTDDYLTVTQFTLQSETSLFIVYKPDTLAFRTVINQQQVYAGNARPWQHYIDNSAILNDYHCGVFRSGASAGSYFILSEIQRADTTISMRINGGTNSDSAACADGFAPSVAISIGRAQTTGAGSGYADGKFAEIILIKASLSTDERQTIEGYLAYKWGRQAALPIDHPYKTNPPTIVDGVPVRNIVMQFYRLEGSPQAIIDQIYNMQAKFFAINSAIYGLRLLTAIIQYYGDTPIFRRLLAQYYGSATLLRRVCSQPYDDYLKFIATIEQEWALPAALRRLIEQKYSAAGEQLQALLAEPYNLNQYQLLRTLLDQVYVLPPSDSLVHTPAVFVTADDILIDPHHVSIEIDESNYAIRGEIHLASEGDFLRCRHLTTTISITIDAIEYVLLADSPRRSRPELGRTEYYVPCISPTVLLDAPYAEPISRDFAGAMAASIAAEMAATASITIAWQLLDWYIPAATLYANNETPLAIIRKLVEAVGGIIQTAPDGSLICRPEYPLSLPDWPTATPDHYLTDMDNFFSVDSTPIIRDGYNRFTISNQDAATAGLTLEAIDLTATSKEIRVYQVPWDDTTTINLHTSGGEWVSIIAEGVQVEELTELVEIIAGEGRTTKPCYILADYDYQQDDLGPFTVAESGTVATDVKDNSLLSITYSTKYHQFTASDSAIEDVQFFPEEVPS